MCENLAKFDKIFIFAADIDMYVFRACRQAQIIVKTYTKDGVQTLKIINHQILIINN